MKLENFISKLEEIKKLAKNPDRVDVRMVDNFSVKEVWFDGMNIYITDITRNGKFEKCR